MIDELHVPAKTPTTRLVDAAAIHTELIENIIEIDEEATEHYFRRRSSPRTKSCSRLVVDAVASGHLIPIVCVSAKTGVGMDELMSDLALCSPCRQARAVACASRRTGARRVELVADPNGPLVAQVFKTRIDPFRAAAELHPRIQRYRHAQRKKRERADRYGARKGTKIHPTSSKCRPTSPEPVDEGQGRRRDIVAVAKNEDLHVGTVLGELTMDEIHFPTPMVGLAVTPKSRGDEGKLSGALHKIVEEDPTLRIEHDPQTHELVINGMSELHLQMIRERLKRRDKVEVDARQPKIPYRETIANQGEGSYRHKKQSGGRGQFGEVHIRLHPLPEGTNIEEEYAVKERFPADARAPARPEEQFPVGRHGRRRFDSQQLFARRGKGRSRAHGAGRDRRVSGAGRVRRGPLRQAPSGR